MMFSKHHMGVWPELFFWIPDQSSLVTGPRADTAIRISGNLFDSKHIIDYLASRFGNDIYISLMSQYTPMPHLLGNENAPEELRRTLCKDNYERLCDHLSDLGQTNAFVQEMSSQGTLMIPDFKL